MPTAADQVQAYWDLKLALGPDYWLRTQAEVLEHLPQWMVADFDCPARGPHDWLVTTSGCGVPEPDGLVYAWCKNCPAKRRTPWPDTQRDALDVIYDLQFSRHR